MSQYGLRHMISAAQETSLYLREPVSLPCSVGTVTEPLPGPAQSIPQSLNLFR